MQGTPEGLTSGKGATVHESHVAGGGWMVAPVTATAGRKAGTAAHICAGVRFSARGASDRAALVTSGGAYASGNPTLRWLSRYSTASLRRPEPWPGGTTHAMGYRTRDRSTAPPWATCSAAITGVTNTATALAAGTSVHTPPTRVTRGHGTAVPLSLLTMSMRRERAVERNVPRTSSTFVKPATGSGAPPAVANTDWEPSDTRSDGEKSRNSTAGAACTMSTPLQRARHTAHSTIQ
jgi:hypothetical protein